MAHCFFQLNKHNTKLKKERKLLGTAIDRFIGHAWA